METFKFRVKNEHKDMRVDKFLARKLSDISRNRIQSLIEKGMVSIPESTKKDIRSSYRLKYGEEVFVNIPERKPDKLKIWKRDLDIIFEDKELAVINKPAPLVVHPAPGHSGRTLVEALLYNFDELAMAGGEKRPGIVHRLDKETSGALLIAKTDRAYYNLKKQFKNREVDKEYRALIVGQPEHKKARIEAPIGRDPHNRTRLMVCNDSGKEALTNYRVIKSYRGFSGVRVNIITGRTHQIRVHFSFLGHPVLGDEKYGGRVDVNGMKINRTMLHSYKIGFIHPDCGEYHEHTASIPGDYKKVEDFISRL